MPPVWTAEDRSISVPADKLVRTARVDLHRIKLACRDRMSTADVERARHRLLCLGDDDPWPCPVGEWEGDIFLLRDGRHEYVAALLLGKERLLVAWIEGQ